MAKADMTSSKKMLFMDAPMFHFVALAIVHEINAVHRTLNTKSKLFTGEFGDGPKTGA